MTDFISRLRRVSTDLSRAKPILPISSGRKGYFTNGKARVPKNPLPSQDPLLFQGKTRNRRHAPSPQRRPLYSRPLFWLALVLGAGTAGGLTRSYRIWQAVEANLPEVSTVLTYERHGTITIKAADGAILQKLGPATRENLTYEEIPDTLIQAFIVAEDRRFYKHHGVDYPSIVRAALANLSRRKVVEGASTITQQLARIVFLDQDRSFQRKVREALLALKIERELDKKQVMERYLNLVYLGAGAYGVADAAWIYFAKPVEALTLAEVALIAGMAPAPSVYSPLVDVDAARQQRNLVLGRMLDNGAITASQAETALNSDVSTTPNEPRYLYSEFPYFTIHIQQQLAQILQPEALETGGLTVETTLNLEWQNAAEETVQTAIEELGPAQQFEQASLVAIDPRNGEIKAMVGGNDFNESQFNRVTQAQRQPGSTFKTFVYTTAVAAGFSPDKSYIDARLVVDGYEPKNYRDRYRGNVTLQRALTASINTVAVKVLIDVGFEPVINIARAMGIRSELQPTYSLALGAWEVNLLELTSAYGTLANQGKQVEAHGISRILDSQGKVIYTADPPSEQAVDADTTAIMTWMLEGVVRHGTGRNAYIGRPVAGKTGTSEFNRDLWFIGYIPQLVAGVWLGNDDSSRTRGASSTAASVWGQFVSQFIDEIPEEEFPSLPRLSDREGSIEAQPVKPRRTRAYNPPETTAAPEPQPEKPAESTQTDKLAPSSEASWSSPANENATGVPNPSRPLIEAPENSTGYEPAVNTGSETASPDIPAAVSPESDLPTLQELAPRPTLPPLLNSEPTPAPAPQPAPAPAPAPAAPAPVAPITPRSNGEASAE